MTHDGTGAGIAALRLHVALNKLSIRSGVFVRESTLSPQGLVLLGKRMKYLNLILSKITFRNLRPKLLDSETIFSLNSTPLPGVPELILQQKAEIVHLHWIGWEFIPLKSLLRINVPIVWTLHDAWAFTGGCHYPFECDHFTDRCGLCPLLRGSAKNDLSAAQFRKKLRIYRNLPILFVSPSAWLAREAKRSPCLEGKEVRIIPNGIPSDVYRPYSKELCREILGIQKGKKVILFGASNIADKRKGFSFLIEAANRLQVLHPDALVALVFGRQGGGLQTMLNIPLVELGYLHDDISRVIAYCAADAMVVPSLSDNFPNTILESMACATPCVSFAAGGMVEQISHKVDGYLAEGNDAVDLANGIWYVVADEIANRRMGEASRLKVESKFDSVRMANAYSSIYSELIKTAGRTR